MNGAVELVEYLCDRYKLAIVTSARMENVLAMAEKCAFLDQFSVVVTREQVTNHKPHPAGILEAAKRLSVPPEKTLYVGDQWIDLVAGIRAGAKSILVPNEITSPNADLYAHGIFDNLHALHDAFQSGDMAKLLNLIGV